MAVQDQQQWLLSRYLKEPNPEHRNAVVAANLPLVWKVARRESERSGHSFEDLVQEGVSGLIKAIERFDPSLGNTLSTAAVPWIRGAPTLYETTTRKHGCASPTAGLVRKSRRT